MESSLIHWTTSEVPEEAVVFFLKLFFLWMWTIIKVFIEFVLLFLFFFFGHEARGVLALQPETEPSPLYWKAKS